MSSIPIRLKSDAICLSNDVNQQVTIKSNVRHPTCSDVEGQEQLKISPFVQENSQYRQVGWWYRLEWAFMNVRSCISYPKLHFNILEVCIRDTQTSCGILCHIAAIGDYFLLMHDNFRPHIARFSESILKSNPIQCMEYSAYFTDLKNI